MVDAELTDIECATIDRACERAGAGVLVRAELMIWAGHVKACGTAIERDVLALFMSGKLRPLPLLDGEGCVQFVPTERVIAIDVGCRGSALCVLDDGHDGEHRFELGSEVR